MGFKYVYVLALASSVAGVTLLIFGDTAVPIYAAFVCLGVGGSGWVLASTTMVLEFGQTEDTPMRLAFVTTLEGRMRQPGRSSPSARRRAGIPAAFRIVLAALIAALLMLMLMLKVRDPRNSHQAS